MSHVDALDRPDRYPRSSAYDPRWVLDHDMGPHPLWQIEDLLAGHHLRSGMRVLDIGSGRGATSVFLAREFGVRVVSVDLWIGVDELQATFDEAGVSALVTPVQADVRTMKISSDAYDAIIAVDSFEYFGTDVRCVPRLASALKTGGLLAMSTPALREDPYSAPIPEYVHRVVGWEAAAWHSPQWWHTHWELSGMLSDIDCRWQEGGRDSWLLWAEALREERGDNEEDPVIAMLEADTEEKIGFTLATARKA